MTGRPPQAGGQDEHTAERGEHPVRPCHRYLRCSTCCRAYATASSAHRARSSRKLDPVITRSDFRDHGGLNCGSESKTEPRRGGVMRVRAARLVAHGEPLEVAEVEVGEPGAGEVLVEMAYGGVN